MYFYMIQSISKQSFYQEKNLSLQIILLEILNQIFYVLQLNDTIHYFSTKYFHFSKERKTKANQCRTKIFIRNKHRLNIEFHKEVNSTDVMHVLHRYSMIFHLVHLYFHHRLHFLLYKPLKRFQ